MITELVVLFRCAACDRHRGGQPPLLGHARRRIYPEGFDTGWEILKLVRQRTTLPPHPGPYDIRQVLLGSKRERKVRLDRALTTWEGAGGDDAPIVFECRRPACSNRPRRNRTKLVGIADRAWRTGTTTIYL